MQRLSDIWWFLAILALVLVTSGLDMVADIRHGVQTLHLMQEAAVFTITFVAILWLLLGVRRQVAEIQRLQAELEEIRHLNRPSDPETLQARQGLAELIARQFEAWQLTRSEMEIGQLLLKGLSLKEIAVLRSVAEKTVRQQASSIYQKAGLSGRHAFSAWFIEDIL